MYEDESIATIKRAHCLLYVRMHQGCHRHHPYRFFLSLGIDQCLDGCSTAVLKIIGQYSLGLLRPYPHDHRTSLHFAPCACATASQGKRGRYSIQRGFCSCGASMTVVMLLTKCPTFAISSSTNTPQSPVNQHMRQNSKAKESEFSEGQPCFTPRRRNGPCLSFSLCKGVKGPGPVHAYLNYNWQSSCVQFSSLNFIGISDDI